MSLRNSSDFLLNFSGGELTGEAKPFYQFKSFQLDVIERQLLNGGASVSLEPKVFDVLVVLVERGGHLVKKDELLQLAWSDSFVEEANIARIIHTLRKVLGEDETGNKFIETVPKKGYRFVAEVKKVSESSAQNNHQNSAIPTAIPLENTPNCPIPVGKGNSLPTPKPKRMIYLILITAGFMSLALLGSLIFFNRQSNSSDKTREVKSIAVLPLKPVNTDTHDLIYELGIAESLIFKLSSVKTLKTRPLSATRKYSDIQQDVIAAGKEQSVDYVLASNYQIVDGKIRVTSQLINVQTGNAEEVLKSEKDLAGILTMEDEIASDIGNPILTWAGNSQNKPSAERGTSDEEAYRLYLQAGFILEDFDEPKIEKAIEYLEQAVKLDPNYAQAYTSLAHAYQFLPTRNQAEDNEHYLRSKEAIEKALALDENMAESHAVLGFIKVNHEGDFAGAEKEYKRAIELDPDSALAHELYAYYLIIPGRFDEALAEEKKGFEIDPASVADSVVYGMILYNARRYDEADAYFKKLMEKDKDSYLPYQWLWNINNARGNEREAYEWFIKYQTQTKVEPEVIALYQNAFRKSGRKGILLEIIKQDKKIVATDNNADLLYEIACFSAMLGNNDQSFEYLDKAFETRRSTTNIIKVDPSLDSLHSDPRFEQLVKRSGLG